MFDISEKLTARQNINRKKQRIFIVGASIATLVASGQDTTDLFSSGDVIGTPTSSDDIISFGAGGGIVDLGAGDDTAQGGDGVDTILGGAGADQINGGAGLDNLVVIGIIVDGEYSVVDLQDVAGTGIDFSALLDVAAINDHAISDIQSGETIDGGADGAILYTFGDVDFTDVALNNITKIYLDAEVIISDESLQTLITEGLTDILGNGTIKAQIDQLDLDGVNVPADVIIMDSEGNIILPEFESTGSVSVEENTTSVGTFIVSDASAVGDVTYELSGTDAVLFNINSSTGEVDFISAPDYETISGSFEITITATDEHQKSVSQNVEITVSDVEEPSLKVEPQVLTSGSEFLVNSEYTADQFEPHITSLSNGGFVITWITRDAGADGSGSAIKAQIFNAAGATVGSEFLVNSEYISNQHVPVITALDTGGFVIVWRTNNTADDGSGYALKAQMYDAVGTTIGNEFLVNSQHASNQNNPTITALNNGGYVISWSTDNSIDDGSNSAIKAQIYNSDGTGVGSEFLVNSQHTGPQYSPAITALDTGGFVIIWETYSDVVDGSGSAVKAQIFDATGTMVGSEFLVNSQHTDSQVTSAVTTLNNGNFVVSWYTFNEADDGDDSAIKAQIFNSDGTLVGGEFLVNSQYSDYQYDPSISALDTGGFVISWVNDDSAQDGSGSAIKAQIFSSAGTPVGGEFLVNSLHTHYQYSPTIASLENGDFVITWTNNDTADDGSGYAVKAQIYSFSETYNYNDGEAADFIITTELHPNRTDDTLGDITISDVPDEATFNQGKNNGDGTWTISQVQIDGLQITFDGDYSGSLEMGLSITSTTNGGVETTGRISITAVVTDIEHTPEFSEESISVEVAENQYVVTTPTAIDLDGDDLTFSLSGDDESFFNIDGSSGEVTFINAPNFEIPHDGDEDNQYDVVVTASDGALSDSVELAITVTDVVAANDVDAPILSMSSIQAFGTEFRVNSYTDDKQIYSSTASLADGGFVTVWASGGKEEQDDDRNHIGQDGEDGGIYGQRYDGQGNTLGDEFLINSAVVENQSSPDVTSFADGGFLVVWEFENSAGSGLRAQKYDEDGNSQGDELQLNTLEYLVWDSHVIDLNDGAYVVSWTSHNQDGDSSGIFAQVFDTDGIENGDVFQVNTYVTIGQKDSQITALSNGGFVIAWESYAQDGSQSGVYFQKFDENGDKVGSETIINSTTEFNQAAVSISAFGDGGFVAVWQDNNASGGDWNSFDIIGNIYDEDGAITLSEFTINQYTTGIQDDPEVTSLSDGSFLVTWQSDEQDGDNYGIYARHFGADGEALSDEFLVNSTVEFQEIDPDITALSNGGFVITWTSDRSILDEDADIGNIFGQVYTVNSGNYEADSTTKIQLTAELADGQVDITLSDIVISDIPDGVSFVDSAGVLVGTLSDGVLTLTQAQLVDLNLKIDEDYDSNVELTISVTAENLDGIQTTTVNLMAIKIVHAPEFDSDDTLTIEIDENSSEVATIVATDPTNQDIHYALLGADADLFDINSLSGELSLIEAENFESPTQLDYQYELVVTATNSDGLVDTKTVIVNVNDVDDAPQFTFDNVYTTYMPDNRTDIGTVAASDDEGDEIVYTLTGNVDDSLFSIDGATGKIDFNAIPDFAVPADVGADNIYNLSVTATSNGLTNTRDVEVHVTDATAGSIFVSNGLSKSGTEFLVNTTTLGSQSTPSVTMLTDGSYVVTWSSRASDLDIDAGIFGQKYAPDGVAIGDEFHVNSYIEEEQEYSDVIGLENGAFLVTWSSRDQDGSDFGVYGQKFDEVGQQWGDEFLINNTTLRGQNYPNSTVLTDGSFIVTWTAQDQFYRSDIYGRKYDADGIVDGNEFKISTSTKSQESSSIVGLSDGGFVVTWHSGLQDGSGYGVYGQLFDSAGDPNVAGEFLINTVTDSSQSYSSVSALENGGFVVVWQSQNQDNGSDGTDGVYGQIYDASGTPSAGEFLINTEVINYQRFASVTTLDDGTFIVVWQSSNQDGDGLGIYGQRFEETGDRVGEEFLINSTIAGNQELPTIAATQNGGFVVVWGSMAQDGSEGGIYAQQYDVDTEFSINYGETTDFDIVTQASQDGVELTSVTIDGLASADNPFNFGAANGDDSWTILKGDLDLGGLLLTVDAAAQQDIDLQLEATFNDGTTSTSSLTLQFDNVEVGDSEINIFSGQELLSSTDQFVFGDGNVDVINFTNNGIEKFDFSVVDDKLEMTEISTGYMIHLNSVEIIENNESGLTQIDVANLFTDGHIDAGVADNEAYQAWLSNSYGYDAP